MAAAMWKPIFRRRILEFSGIQNQRACKRWLTIEAHAKLKERRRRIRMAKLEEPPLVRPLIKYPPGSWRGISRAEAWNFWEMEKKTLKFPTVRQRIEAVQRHIFRGQAWVFKADNYKARLLDYQFDKTKTFPVQGLPDVYDQVNVDREMEMLTPIIKNIILTEYKNILRRDVAEEPFGFQKTKFSKLLMKNIVLTLMMALSPRHEHLLTAQFAEDVFQQAVWRRYMLPDDKNMEGGYKGRDKRFQGEYKSSFHIRTEMPLPEFAAKNSDICFGKDYPKCRYHPRTMGQKRAKYTPRVIPGTKYGDPCEFSYLALETVNQFLTDRVEKEYRSIPEAMPDLWKGYGLSSAFLSSVAVAHFQGYTTFLDLEYPITNQVVVTDGRKFLFTAYQLNTLMLWKSDKNNPARNVCWFSDEMKLFEGFEDGEIVGFNEETLRTLLKFFVIGTPDRGYDLKPSIRRREETQRIPELIEEEYIPDEIIYDEKA